MRVLELTCDQCGQHERTDGTWPSGWYFWMRQDLCHACAVPKLIASLEACSDPGEIPIPMTGRYGFPF